MMYHNYILLNSRKSIFDIPKDQLKLLQNQFVQVIEKEKKVIVHAYTTLGLKVHTSILLWFQSDSIITIQDVLSKLMHTQLGKHMKITYTLFGMTRPTQYSPSLVTHLDTDHKGGKYLIIYPFTKTQEWYLLDFEKRKELMKGHIAIGKGHPQITQLLLYSFGVDDSEFIVSYETDDLSEFQQLVMDLRSDKVRKYTLKDTPIFTCIYRPIAESLHFL